jgi:hypothetical protein
MRRIGTWLFNGFAAASLLLCVARTIAWIWSDAHSNDFRPFSGYGGIQLRTAHRMIVYLGPPYRPQPWTFYTPASQRMAIVVGPTTVFIECWKLALGFGIIPAIWLFVRVRQSLINRRSRDRNEIHCSNCEYDLRATPDRCPECGTASAREIEN